MTEIHVNDYGWDLNITVKDQDENPKDLSSAEAVNIILCRPNNGGDLVRPAQFTTDGTDGAIYYTVQDGDILDVGTWQIQVEIISAGSLLRSNIAKLKVLRNI